MNEKLKKIKNLLSELIPEEAEKYNSMTTEQGVIYWDGEEEIKVGDYVYVADENGENRTPAEEGEYVVDEKTTVVIKDGKVEEIKLKEETPEEEEKPEEEKDELSKLDTFKATVAKYEESYDEKIQKIAQALVDAGYDGWIYEAGDDYAVAECWNVETESPEFVRFDVEWVEDKAVLSNPKIVKQAFVPVEEETPAETPAKEEEEKPAEQDNMEEEEKPEEEEEEKPEEERDLAKELDDLKAIVEELQKKLEKVEEEEPKTPQEEFEAISVEKDYNPATKYGRALRK